MSVEKIKKKESLFKLHTKYNNEEFISKFREYWDKNAAFCDPENSIHLRDHPFKLCTLQDFISNDEDITKIMDEIIKDVEWKRLHTDFLEFHQSPDLSSVISDYLMNFYKYLQEEIMPWMERLTGERLSHISASCSMYNVGDRLLIHNDCVSDRRIAYVFYLSPWDAVKTWTEEMGGALELFKEDKENCPQFPAIDKIFPKNNQFLFFHVNTKSWHQVGEVLTFDYPRVTINGWFHGPGEKHPIIESSSTWDDGIQNSPLNRRFRLSDWIGEEYLERKTKKTIQKHIEEHSQISLQKFIKPDKLEALVEEIKKDVPYILWEKTASACERNCDTLNMESLISTPNPLSDFMQFLSSKGFFHLLHEYTELDLSGADAQSPRCFVEIQRWKSECYTMLVNSGAANNESGILDAIFYLNEFSEAGKYIYVPHNKESKENEEDSTMSDVEEEEDEDDGPLIIQPKSGAINLIYRMSDMTRFGAYVSKHLKMGNEYVYVVICSYKE